MPHFKYYFSKLPDDQNSLEKIAGELGGSMHLVEHSQAGTKSRYEMQRRILETVGHRRDSYLWVIALASAVASVISAAAAWWAIAYREKKSTLSLAGRK